MQRRKLICQKRVNQITGKLFKKTLKMNQGVAAHPRHSEDVIFVLSFACWQRDVYRCNCFRWTFSRYCVNEDREEENECTCTWIFCFLSKNDHIIMNIWFFNWNRTDFRRVNLNAIWLSLFACTSFIICKWLEIVAKLLDA